MRTAIFKMRSRTRTTNTSSTTDEPQQDTSLRSEIIALWSHAGLEIDEMRLAMFDRMSPSFQREIVENARQDVVSLSAVVDHNQSEGRAR
jgi:hypothetical protein